MTVLLTDTPLPGVRRLTLNRPEKRNALNNELRAAIFNALEANDRDAEVRLTIVRGAGPAFCSGYDLSADNRVGQPYHSAAGLGQWSRHVVEGWFRVWDLAKPVIAQVHGYCLAGGSELATCCHLVYIAEDAKMGYPAVRFGVPDMHFHAWFLGMRRAMEMMLTGDSVTGVEAVAEGWANRAFPEAELDQATIDMAVKIASLPSDLVQLNKRVVHRQMDHMGLRSGIRAGTEICALGIHTQSMKDFMETAQTKGLTAALSKRDEPFGDYRTSH